LTELPSGVWCLLFATQCMRRVGWYCRHKFRVYAEALLVATQH